MKKVCFIALFVAALWSVAPGQRHYGGPGSASEKSPAVAALLSLQPMPIDMGSFYAGNWERGIVYTVAEITLFVPGMVLLSQQANWWGHHSYYDSTPNRKTWTPVERKKFYYLLGGYVLLKAISAFDAGYCVEKQNAALMLGYDRSTESVAVSVSIPLQ